MSKQRSTNTLLLMKVISIVVIFLGFGFINRTPIFAQDIQRFINIVSLVRGEKYWINNNSDWFVRFRCIQG